MKDIIVWVCFTINIYQMPDSACNRNISGISFGNTSKILGEVTMVTNGDVQAESGI
jgi:hypothetical protein